MYEPSLYINTSQLSICFILFTTQVKLLIQGVLPSRMSPVPSCLSSAGVFFTRDFACSWIWHFHCLYPLLDWLLDTTLVLSEEFGFIPIFIWDAFLYPALLLIFAFIIIIFFLEFSVSTFPSVSTQVYPASFQWLHLLCRCALIS